MTAAADIPPAAQPDGIPWERGRPARIRNLPTLPPPPPDPGVNHKHPLHHKPETGFTSCQAMGQGALCRPQDHSPPGGGSRQDRGEARGRAGGGAPPPRLVIYREKNIGSPAWRPGATPHRISLRLSARLLRLPFLGARASRPHPVPANAPSPASPWPTAPSSLERGSPPGETQGDVPG